MKTVLFLIVIIGIPGALIWSIIKNAKATLLGLVGLSSLMAIIPMLTLVNILAHVNEMSAAPSIRTISLVLIVCVIGYLILTSLCIWFAIKNCKPNFENYAKFTKTIFLISIAISVITFTTLTIGSMLDAGLKKSVTEILFMEWGRMSGTMVMVEFIGLLLIFVFAIWGLFAKSRKIKEKVQKTKTDIKIPNISSDDIVKGAEAAKQKTTELYNKTATSYQGVFKRAKQILLSPQSEYQAIEQEDESHIKVLTSYILPLLLIPVLFAFIGYGLVGFNYGGYHYSQVNWGFRMAIIQMVVLLGGIYLSSIVINALSDNFGVTKNFNRIFSLVAYAYTPVLLAGVFHIHYSLWWIVLLVGLYGLYLVFVGLRPMLKPAKDKAVTYSIISLIVTVVGYIVLYQTLRAIIFPNYLFP